MSTIGTFGSFTTALLGIYTAQHGLSVTGNNISNINTPGYTRQSLDQVSLHMSGAERYRQKYDVTVGGGSLAVGVSQLRDPYLDIRYRSEAASVGAMDKKLNVLNSLAMVLDDVGAGDDEHGIFGAQFSDLLKTIQNLSDQTNQGEYDTQVRSSAAALVSLFKSTANSLQEVYDNTVSGFERDLKKVNETLISIRELNASIRKSDLHGDPALELRDERNRLIDELSEYIKIDVTYTEEDIGTGMTVEKMSIRLANANPDASVTTDSSLLVDGIYATQFEMPKTVAQRNPANDPDNPYLDAAGNPTGDITQANQVENDNFFLSLTKLVSSKGKEWEEISKPRTTTFADQTAYDAAVDAIVNDPNYDAATGTIDDGKGTKKVYEFVANGGEFSIVEKTCKYTQEVNLDDNDLYGSLQSSREMLTESGEFASADYVNTVDEKAASKRGIRYYQKALDLLANKFANEFNKANNGYMTNEAGDYLDNSGKVIELNGEKLNKYNKLTDAQKTELENLNQTLEEYLEANGAYKPEGAGNLFSNLGSGDDATGINASNIEIAYSWGKGSVKVVPSYVKPSDLDGTGSTANENIMHFRALLEKSFDFFPNDIVDDASDISMFTGSFTGMLNNISGVLGNDQRSTQIMLRTYTTQALDLDTSRDAISGVDLNDEAANLIQYQKAYTAACRLMTTLDEALEKLISNTGTVGR